MQREAPFENDIRTAVPDSALHAWQNGTPVNGLNPALWRMDPYGYRIHITHFMNRKSPYGWVILRFSATGQYASFAVPVQWQKAQQFCTDDPTAQSTEAMNLLKPRYHKRYNATVITFDPLAFISARSLHSSFRLLRRKVNHALRTFHTKREN